ncbi:uncharacterized protein LOC112506248 [Cynara cardunculus var. scolymus]|uniref:uncharacterized protein LOC112506248 n=1 Tax=Cynara cardunculus var. scolymus TaxID=59895 RepID=UPI000D627488|nr:uncharacterized protein LOC112506248 [Cynara cardunculus var. scolymus]
MAIGGFDIIIGMDWLVENQAEILCSNKLIRIPLANGDAVLAYGKGRKGNVVLLSKRHLEIRKIEDVKIVNEFPDVFPEDLPGLPPVRQVEFQIDLIPGTAPIARSPYRLAPSEMRELMSQLQDLLDKGFIKPSS